MSIPVFKAGRTRGKIWCVRATSATPRKGGEPHPSEHGAHTEAAASQGRPKPQAASWTRSIPFLEGFLEQRVLER